MPSDKEINELLREIKASIAWINGRIANIEGGSRFSNEAPDIELEARSIMEGVNKIRKAIKLARLEDREAHIMALQKAKEEKAESCPCGSTEHASYDCPVDDWQ